MKENYSIDVLTKKLENINDKYLNKLNNIETNFNNLKDEFYKITKEYEDKKFEKNNINNNPNNINEKSEDSEELNSMIKHLLEEERNNNINYINSCLNKYNISQNIINNNEIENIKYIVENFENEIKQIMNKLDEKIENIKMEKNNNTQVINIEMNNEINNLIKKINDTSLDLISSNSDKANAIQDVIKIYLNKFKTLKNEFNDFEDKVIKLISELLDKVVILKKGSY
jgi:hypothetical protein